MTLKVAIIGSKGRMGQTLLSIANENDATVVIEKDVGDPLTKGLETADVIIDFSFHKVTPEVARKAAELNIPIVLGTTGHSESEKEVIIEASKSIPIVWAGNYSVGVSLLFYLTEMAAGVLGNAYDPEILEFHHRHKKDAPSGTALNLAESIQAADGFKSAKLQNARSGESGERSREEIALHAIRGGEIVGEHTVFFIGENDRIELTHKASDRGIFASGAYRAAHWVKNQNPGVYSMRDVLGFKSK